jgi:hypothetical protein
MLSFVSMAVTLNFKVFIMLSLPQVRDVCLSNNGAQQCRYLSFDSSSGADLCIKKVSAKKAVIDSQVKKFIEKAVSQGQEPKDMGRAIGDNCKGYPSFKAILQGYDIDGGP